MRRAVRGWRLLGPARAAHVAGALPHLARRGPAGRPPVGAARRDGRHRVGTAPRRARHRDDRAELAAPGALARRHARHRRAALAGHRRRRLPPHGRRAVPLAGSACALLSAQLVRMALTSTAASTWAARGPSGPSPAAARAGRRRRVRRRLASAPRAGPACRATPVRPGYLVSSPRRTTAPSVWGRSPASPRSSTSVPDPHYARFAPGWLSRSTAHPALTALSRTFELPPAHILSPSSRTPERPSAPSVLSTGFTCAGSTCRRSSFHSASASPCGWASRLGMRRCTRVLPPDELPGARRAAAEGGSGPAHREP